MLFKMQGMTRQLIALGDPVEHARGIEVAGPRGIDDLVHRLGGNFNDLVAGQDDRPLGAACHRRDIDQPDHLRDRIVERVGLEQRRDLVMVGEQNVDMTLDQVAEATTANATRLFGLPSLKS